MDADRLTASNASRSLSGIRALDSRLQADLLAYRQTTTLDDALAEYDRRLLFSKLQMFVVLILIAMVVLYYVVTLSSLVAEQRRGEIALLRSRGAGSGQILAVFVLEGATIAALAAVVAPLLAATAISFLGYTPAFSDLSGGARLPVHLGQGAYAMSALGGVLSFVALMAPAIKASRQGVTRFRQESARPSRFAFFPAVLPGRDAVGGRHTALPAARRAGLAGRDGPDGRRRGQPAPSGRAGDHSGRGGDGAAEGVPCGDGSGQQTLFAAPAGGPGNWSVADVSEPDPLRPAGAAAGF